MRRLALPVLLVFWLATVAAAEPRWDRIGIFIGINDYPEFSRRAQLRGCVNDARRMHAIFTTRFGFERTTLLFLFASAKSELPSEMDLLYPKPEHEQIALQPGEKKDLGGGRIPPGASYERLWIKPIATDRIVRTMPLVKAPETGVKQRGDDPLGTMLGEIMHGGPATRGETDVFHAWWATGAVIVNVK